MEPAATEAEAAERIRLFEQGKAILAGAQAKETASFEAKRLTAEAARGIPKARRGNGLAAEIGLARRQPPARGTRYLELARALAEDLPQTRAALTSGVVNEDIADLVAKETASLSSKHRREVDAAMAPRLTAGLGPRQLAAEVRAHAQRLDPQSAAKQFTKAKAKRCVMVRPAGHGMAQLIAQVPTHEAVATQKSLDVEARKIVAGGHSADANDPAAGTRTRDQIMADLLVERVTGQRTAGAVAAEVQVVMTDAALFAADSSPAWLNGHGPIPAEVARRWLSNPDAKVFLRRVFTRPETNQLVGLESRSRNFPDGLRAMIMLRDQICRSPYCDAPIRESDHVVPVRDGGATTWGNASGLCVACNQIKENSGWRHTSTQHQLTVETPTGHEYISVTGDVLPGRPPQDHTASPPATGPPTDEALPDDDEPPERRRSVAFLIPAGPTITLKIGLPADAA